MKWALYLAALSLAYVPFSGAQLSTSVSPDLDNDLNGLDSNVAPIPSTEIEPGANNLTVPEERQLPFDAIGASVVATIMDPTVNQYYSTVRTPYQIDGSVRDSTMLTGQGQRTPVNITDVIGRKVGGMDALTRLKAASATTVAGPFSISGTGSASSWGAQSQALLPMNGNLSPGNSPSGTASDSSGQPSPYAASSAAAMPAVSAATTTVSGATGQRRNHTGVGRSANDNMAGSRSQQTQTGQAQDDIRSSPLERVDSQVEQALQPSPDSPFRDLNQTSFLNPDITLSASRQTSTGQKTKTALTSSSRTRNTASGSNSALRQSLTVSSAEARLLKKQEIETGRPKKPKWRNPILQQMDEEDSNP